MSADRPARSCPDMQEHLATLDAAGLLHRIDHPVNKDTEMHPLVRWQYCGGIGEDQRKAFLFTNVVDGSGRRYDADVAIGALSANPEIYGIGMRQPLDRIGPTWLHAIDNPVPPVEVTDAPCQEVVLTGDDVTQPGKGLAALPIPVSTPGFDVSPYFTAGVWVTKDPDTGVQNMGVYRGNLKAPDRVVVMMERATLAGGYMHWKKHQARKQPMPAAVALGCPPLVEFAGPQKLPLGDDEIGVAGALAGAPIEVVRAKTVDLLVPAYAQVIVEGFIDPEYLEPEAPFGESHGYMGLEEYNLVMTVTAITRRRNAVVTSLISQVTPSESSVIKKLAYEPLYLAHLRDTLNIKNVKRVAMHEPLTNLRAFVFVVVDDDISQTEVWRALEGAASLQPAVGKFCIAINEDIDPANTDHVLWALAFRCHPVRDLHVLPYRAHGHSPVVAGMEVDATVLADATQKAPMPPVALPKKEFMERAKQLWEELGLPALRPQSPWYGYSLGEWEERWDAKAARAAAGDWVGNGAETWTRRRILPETNVPTAEIDNEES